MLFFRDPQRYLRWPISTEPACLHFQTQAMDEMFDVKRQWGAAFHRDVSIEFGGFDDPQKFDTGEAAMRDWTAIPSPALTSAQTVVPKRARMVIS